MTNPRIARAEYGADIHVVRLVVVDGSLCAIECPHRVPTQGCDGFWACGTVPVIEGQYRGRALRGPECANKATIDSDPRALRAYARLIALRGMKADSARMIERKKKSTESVPRQLSLPGVESNDR